MKNNTSILEKIDNYIIGLDPKKKYERKKLLLQEREKKRIGMYHKQLNYQNIFRHMQTEHFKRLRKKKKKDKRKSFFSKPTFVFKEDMKNIKKHKKFDDEFETNLEQNFLKKARPKRKRKPNHVPAIINDRTSRIYTINDYRSKHYNVLVSHQEAIRRKKVPIIAQIKHRLRYERWRFKRKKKYPGRRLKYYHRFTKENWWIDRRVKHRIKLLDKWLHPLAFFSVFLLTTIPFFRFDWLENKINHRKWRMYERIDLNKKKKAYISERLKEISNYKKNHSIKKKTQEKKEDN